MSTWTRLRADVQLASLRCSFHKPSTPICEGGGNVPPIQGPDVHARRTRRPRSNASCMEQCCRVDLGPIARRLRPVPGARGGHGDVRWGLTDGANTRWAPRLALFPRCGPGPPELRHCAQFQRFNGTPRRDGPARARQGAGESAPPTLIGSSEWKAPRRRSQAHRAANADAR